jgi:membrane protease YdiL (CAAX protease family)
MTVNKESLPMKYLTSNKTLWKTVIVCEIIAAALVIILDLFVPTIVILGMIIVSLLIHCEGTSTLGFRKAENGPRMIGFVFLCVVLWQLIQFSLVMPVLNHLTGTTQNLSSFAELKGNLGLLFLYLVVSWTLAAFGEEIVYRGYLQKRFTDLFGMGMVGVGLSIGISSLLFGIAHTEQGVIGVTLTFLDALFFSWLKMRYKNNLWAAVLAHGFSNSVGLLVFYFTGPIYGLW